MNSLSVQLAAAESSAIIIKRTLVPVLRVSGRDAERYLHGRVTQNIKSLRDGQSARSMVLTPQGKIQGHFTIVRRNSTAGTEFFIVSDPLPDGETDFISALMQFKVADDVTVESLSDKASLWSIFGPERAKLLGEFAHAGDHVLIFPLSYGGVESTAVLFLERTEQLLPQALIDSAILGDEHTYQILRVRSGVPQFGFELNEKVLGPETDVTDLVSFNKGCYAGQEVVEMATARGRPNRKLTRFSTDGEQRELIAGAEVLNSENATCGSITSTAYYPPEDKTYVLGLVKSSALEQATEFSALGRQLAVL